jgi:cytochrome c-type biogenesis protein CcmH/NrfG
VTTSSPSSAPARARVPWRIGAAVGALAFLGVAASCANQFVWDDEQFILKNSYLTAPALLPRLVSENIVAGAGLLSNLYRPVQSLTHAVDVRVWGLQPAGHHFTNVLLHAALAVALWRLLVGLLPLWPATLATLWYALHPMQAEAVAYTSGRGDTMAMLFLCSGLLAFPRRPIVSLACAALAMGCKESLALFPLFLALHEFAHGRRLQPLRHLPFWMLSGAYVLARLTVLNFKNILNFYEQPNILTESFLARVCTYLTTIPKALQLWLWPADLHHERTWMVYATPASSMVLWSAACVAAIWMVAWAARRRARVVTVGIAWFFVATIPTSNLLVLINAVFYDHWFLLPGIGLTMVVGWLLAWAWTRPSWRAPAAAVAAVAIAACALVTQGHIAIWRTPMSLYSHILRHEPRSAKITNNLAMAYATDGRLPEAITMYRRAIALSDEYAQTHHNLANAYLELGLEEQAVEELHRAVALQPSFHHSWITLAAIYFKHQRYEEAEPALRRAIAAHPFDASGHMGLAFVHLARGDRTSARAAVDEGLRHLPGHAELLKARAQLDAMGQTR